LPAALLLFAFLATRQRVLMDSPGPLGRLVALKDLTSLLSFDLYEYFVMNALMLGLVALMVLLLVRRSRSIKFVPSDLWLLIAFVWLAVYLVAPQTGLVSVGGMAGGGFIAERLQLFPVFGFVLWVAAQPLGRAVRVGSVAAAAILVFILAGIRFQYYRAADVQFAEYVTAGSKMEPGGTFLPLHLRRGGWSAVSVSPIDSTSKRVCEGLVKALHQAVACDQPLNRVRPFHHASNYLALEHGVHSLRNYEANMGYFPLLFRPERNPYRQLGNIEGAPAEIRFADARAQVDYVLVWPLDETSPLPPEIVKELTDFEFVGSSAPHGLARVYRRVPGTQQ
jgi:hypothetical protein